MRNVIDTASSQRNLDFGVARGEGFTDVYVKLGGDNVPRYVAPYYVQQVDRARAAGFEHVGHYWVPSAAQDPAGAADYFVNNLRGWKSTDFAVLDNESLDGASRYSDAQCAVWIERVKSRLGISGAQVLTYSGLADARGTAWPATLATGTNFIIAAYSYGPFAWADFGTIPRARIVGHQTGGRAIGGVVTDTNVFTDTAFDYAQTAPAGTGGSTVGYSNVNNFVVILADNRDPEVSWANHLARGSAGGVDCVAPIGTPIYAPDDCVLANTPNNGTGGNTITLSFANGWRDQMMHLSQFVNPGTKRKGEVVGWSGDTAAPGQPHVHWHRIDPQGRRQNPWHYFTGSSTAGTTPIGIDMALKDSLEIVHSDRGYLALGPAFVYEIANQDGIDGGKKLAILQKLGVPVTEVSVAEWDILKTVFLGNQAAAASAVYAASLVKIPAVTSTGGTVVSGPSAADIATAVRAKFKSEPLV